MRDEVHLGWNSKTSGRGCFLENSGHNAALSGLGSSKIWEGESG